MHCVQDKVVGFFFVLFNLLCPWRLSFKSTSITVGKRPSWDHMTRQRDLETYTHPPKSVFLQPQRTLHERLACVQLKNTRQGDGSRLSPRDLPPGQGQKKRKNVQAGSAGLTFLAIVNPRVALLAIEEHLLGEQNELLWMPMPHFHVQLEHKRDAPHCVQAYSCWPQTGIRPKWRNCLSLVIRLCVNFKLLWKDLDGILVTINRAYIVSICINDPAILQTCSGCVLRVIPCRICTTPDIRLSHCNKCWLALLPQLFLNVTIVSFLFEVSFLVQKKNEPVQIDSVVCERMASVFHPRNRGT